MIFCISTNPAIDRRLRIKQLEVGQVNRASSAESTAGGKAAHVAIAARALGEEVRWVGFLGGATGDECEHGLLTLGIPVTAVRTQEPTRVNLEMLDDAGVVTEVLEPGGAVSWREIEALVSTCEALFARSGDRTQVVLSGSLPPGAPRDLYARLTRAARERDCGVLLDTSGDALLDGLASSPDLVKPNRDEAERALALPVRDAASAIDAARRMIDRGARGAAISLGADGLVWLREAEASPLHAQAPAITAHSTVGCGDATVAGFAVARSRGLNAEETLRLATACGGANCLTRAPGLIDFREVERIEPLVTVRIVKEDLK